MGLRHKPGRPAGIPKKKGTFHVTGKWANRLWIVKESRKYNLPLSCIFDELVESVRFGRKYDPQDLADYLSWGDEETTDVKTYEKKKKEVQEIVSKLEKKIEELDRRRRRA